MHVLHHVQVVGADLKFGFEPAAAGCDWCGRVHGMRFVRIN
jgi:hypothetical protein